VNFLPKPKVTVAILAYYEEYLRECIESVLAQTYRDMKIVVYDDCAPADLKSIVDSFDDDRLSYVRHKEKAAMGDRANIPLSLCDTEYINLFHGDDRMFPWMIERLIDVFDRQPTAGMVVSCHFLEYGGQLPAKPSGVNGVLYKENEYIKEVCKKGDTLRFIPASMTFRTECYRDLGVYFRPEAGICGDMYYMLEANSRGMNFFFLKQPLLEYRIHNASIAMSSPFEEWTSSHKKLIDFIASLNLGYDLGKLKKNFAIYDIAHLARGMSSKGDFERVLSGRKFLEDKYGCFVPDSELWDWVSIVLLGHHIIAVGRLEVSFGEYKKEEKELSSFGLKVPVKRKIKWFLKYVLFQRTIGLIKIFLRMIVFL
jgi:glycosyltransferase involved in cell wall biosynthesis